MDWFKSDSQGTDLRLFRSLGSERCARVLAADFEPGLIDAYEGEDKLHQVLAFMETLPFWLSRMTVRGTPRLSRAAADGLSTADRRALGVVLEASPAWAELSYLNLLRQGSAFGVREYVLSWVFATTGRQHGFALETARAGARRFPSEPFFDSLERHSRDRLAPSVSALARGMLTRVARRVLAG